MLANSKTAGFPRGRHSLLVTVSLLSVCACLDETPQRREALEQAARRTEVERLTSQLKANPRDASVLRALAREYWALGDYNGAQHAFEGALAAEPNADAQLDLISLLYHRGRYIEAQMLAGEVLVHASPAWLRDLRKQFAALMKISIGGAPAVELRRAAGELRNSLDMTLVEVPSGSFVRGHESGESDHRPARRIHVDSFFIGKFEVTRGQFRQFLDETGYRFASLSPGIFDPEFINHPVISVSWEDAQAFTMWLSAREQAAYRLPTEAEWEFAARGTEGFTEPWGNHRGRAGVDGNWGRTSMPELKALVPPVARVGTFPRDRSPFGVFDLAGNVKEWCLDEYDATYYAWSPATNPYGPTEKTGIKVQRGGSWNDPGPGLFAIRRSHAASNQAYTGNGFRLVRETRPPRRTIQPS